MRKLMVIGCMVAVATSVTIPVRGAVICSGESAAIRVNAPVPSSVNKKLTICASPWAGDGESVTVSVDGTVCFSTTNQAETAWRWQSLTTGNHTLTCTFGTNVLTKTLNVTALDFYVTPAPNPPMAKDSNMSITPTTRNFGVDGGGNAIITSGSGTWTAAVSDPWITLNATSGNVGYPVAYTVSANTNVEQRTGYVYVSGWVHTVTQDGVGGTISPENVTFEHQGGSGTIAVTAANKMVWQARPDVDWLYVTPTSGMGEGSVTYQVAPYNEVATRQGTLTVAGSTFTVFQYGRRMKLSTYKETRDYETHVIPITVNALAITQWNVTPNNSWISVVDAGNGQGADLVTIAIAENPSYRARTGTVTIGTETFTVTQQGRPTAALSFNVSPAASTASVEGANGLISVTATPDLPWTATSGANWITVYAATATGAGNGNVVYSASPNPTLFERTGTVIVTPEAASGMAAKTHTVTQPAAQSALSSNGYEFEASGEPCSVEVSVASIVQWTIQNTNSWITVNGSTSRTGPETVVLQAAANDTVYPRSGTVTIAGKTFIVSQKARSVELEYDTKLFGTDGGYESISIHPDGNSAWTAVASDATWITIFQGDSGTGDGEIMYIVSPYVGDGTARTGWIEVGDKKVYISQRAYDLSIEPNGTNVVGNAGAGEFGVSASIGDVWTAIVTEPWITLVSGYDSGTGNGVVRFLYTENTTGKTRTGKIIVAGEVYTLQQRARQMVAITAAAEHGGHVSGGGSYDLGEQVTLTAVPDSGYQFSYWTGATNSMQNPITVTADVAQSYTAVFAPLPIAFTSVASDTTGVSLSWNNLAWAATYRIYRGVTSVPSSATVVVELANNGSCTYLDASGDVDVEYWYWIEAEGPSDTVMSDPMTGRKVKPIVHSPITYTNLRGATNPNPATYQEGTVVTFSNPGAVTGYTFAGWMPSQITADMTGAQTVRAAWTAHGYTIAYNPNGGSGTMEATAMTYDSEGTVAPNGFTRTGYTFTGWATNAMGEVAYVAGQPVTNLTAQSGGVVTLYAVWTVNGYSIVYDSNGGSGTMEATAMTYDAEGLVAANGFTRRGYTFAGWATNSMGEVVYAASQPVTNLTAQSGGVVTLYAVWERIVGPIFTIENGVLVAVDINGETDIAVPESVTSIGDGAFCACIGLVSVTIPNSVTNIGDFVFEGCTDLMSVTIGNGVTSIGRYMFMGCRGLTSVTMPDSVTSFGEYAFYYCSGLMDVTIPGSVTNIGYGAFEGCSSLTNVTICNGVTRIGCWGIQSAGITSVTIPDSVTYIDWDVFNLCDNLKTVSLPSRFRGQDDLLEHAFGYGVRFIFRDALVTFDANGGTGGWSRMMDYGAQIVAPTVARTGYTFTGWSPAPAMTVPDHAVSYVAQWTANGYTIAYNSNGGAGTMETTAMTYDTEGFVASNGFIRTGYTFAGWATNSMGEVVYAAGQQVTNLTAQSGGVVMLYAVWERIVGPIFTIEDGVLVAVDLNGETDVVIPEGVTNIGEYAFAYCDGLTNVVFPDGLITISACAFDACSGLTEVRFPDSLRDIEYGAFSFCLNLTNVTFPDGLSYLGRCAFSDDYALRSVTLPAGFKDSRSMILEAFEFNHDIWISFKGCNLKYVISGDNVMEVEDGILVSADVNTDKDIAIPGGVMGVGVGAFSGSSLTGVTIPEGVTNIGDYAFMACGYLKRVTLPGSLKAIGESAFEGCNLNDIILPDGVTHIEDYALCGNGLTNVTFGIGVIYIGEYVFCNCKGLTEVTIPDRVTYIGITAFDGCDSLKTVSLPARFRDQAEVLSAAYSGVTFIFRDAPVDPCAPAPVYSVAGGPGDGLPVVVAKSGGNSTTSDYLDTGDLWADGRALHDDARYVVMSNYTQYVTGGRDTLFGGRSLQVGTADYGLGSKAKGGLYLYNRNEGADNAAVFPGDGLVLVNGSCFIRYYFDSFIDGKVTVASDAAHPFVFYDNETVTTKLYSAGYLHFRGPVVGAAAAALLVRGHRDNVRAFGLKIGGDWSRYHGSVTVTGEVDTVGTYFPLGSICRTELWITNTVVAGTVTMHDGTFLRSMVEGEPFTVSNLVLKAGATLQLSGDVTVGSLTMEEGAVVDVMPRGGGAPLPALNVLGGVVVPGVGGNVTVPGSWLAEKTARTATDVAENGRKVWQCYALGLDPERADDDFRITRFWMDGNVPMFEFSHTADGSGNTFVPRIRKMGSATPTGPWQEVPTAGNPAYRFFKVEVALP